MVSCFRVLKVEVDLGGFFHFLFLLFGSFGGGSQAHWYLMSYERNSHFIHTQFLNKVTILSILDFGALKSQLRLLAHPIVHVYRYIYNLAIRLVR